MPNNPSLQVLTNELEQSLSLLKAYNVEGATLSQEPLPSLLEQCQEICNDIKTAEPVRSIHHLACTGGTLITKCLGGLPNTILLNEIDPLSTIDILPWGQQPFAPRDLIAALRYGARTLSQETLIETFIGALSALHRSLSIQGYHLVLRDHAHSQFCHNCDPDLRPTLQQIIQDHLPSLSVVTVRHPVDSFLSLSQNDWVRFAPPTFDEYCKRSLNFLDRHAGTAIYRYEDFVKDPETVLQEICTKLALPYTAITFDLTPAIQISGDSGRTGIRISPRPRRDVPEHLQQACADSEYYTALCTRLGYSTEC